MIYIYLFVSSTIQDGYLPCKLWNHIFQFDLPLHETNYSSYFQYLSLFHHHLNIHLNQFHDVGYGDVIFAHVIDPYPIEHLVAFPLDRYLSRFDQQLVELFSAFYFSLFLQVFSLKYHLIIFSCCCCYTCLIFLTFSYLSNSQTHLHYHQMASLSFQTIFVVVLCLSFLNSKKSYSYEGWFVVTVVLRMEFGKLIK